MNDRDDRSLPEARLGMIRHRRHRQRLRATLGDVGWALGLLLLAIVVLAWVVQLRGG